MSGRARVALFCPVCHATSLLTLFDCWRGFRYRDKADNLIELTARGSEQARLAGERIHSIIGDDRVIMCARERERVCILADYKT